MNRTFMRTFALFLLSMVMFSCARQVKVLKMEPLRFVAVHTDKGVRVELMDPDKLFHEATEFLKKKDYKNAASRYKFLLKNYPKNSLSGPATYNLGMSLMGLKRYTEARALFLQYIKRSDINQKDRCDAQEKAADCLSGMGKHRAALQEMETLKAKSCIDTDMDKLRINAKMAHEYNQLGDPAMAMRMATPMMRLWRLNREKPGFRMNYFAAMAYYEFAEAYVFLFKNIKLYLPTDRMEKDLTDKAQYFLSAQSALFNTIRVHNTYFSIKASMKIGKLYEDFYDDLIHAEVPPEFTQEERRIYFEELKKKIRPLVEKAMIVYRENLRIGRYYRIPGKWLQEARKRLKRLENLLKRDEVKK